MIKSPKSGHILVEQGCNRIIKVAETELIANKASKLRWRSFNNAGKMFLGASNRLLCD